MTEFDPQSQSGFLELSCSKGTYVRTIIDDIGARLGTGAVMTSLVRTVACGFSLDECITLDEARQLAENGELEARLRSVESLFTEFGELKISEQQSKRFSNGGALDITRTQLKNANLPDKTRLRIKNRATGEFLGFGVTDSQSHTVKILKLF